jgi:succinate dehydrogenase / fumarate reductase iron-sulfur subunit
MIASTKPQQFTVKIKRQAGREQPTYWQSFVVPYRPNLNIIAVLQHIAANPTTQAGENVEPVVWDSGCLEEVCGACTMVINGKVRQSCSCLVDELLDDEATITLEPMSKFPTIRDLFVDRQRMFDNLKKHRCWVPIDGMHDLGEGPKESPDSQEERYALSRCMTCGCCLEACPQFTLDNDFVGAQTFGQVLYFNQHETGQKEKPFRLEKLMEPGGISDCGNSQNCVRVCPKDIPLTAAIGKLGRQTTVHAVKKFFTGK